MYCHTEPTWAKFISDFYDASKIVLLIQPCEKQRCSSGLITLKDLLVGGSTGLKNMSQLGSYAQLGWKFKMIQNDVVLIFKYQQLWTACCHFVSTAVRSKGFEIGRFMWSKKPGRCSAVFKYEWIFSSSLPPFQALNGYDDSPDP